MRCRHDGGRDANIPEHYLEERSSLGSQVLRSKRVLGLFPMSQRKNLIQIQGFTVDARRQKAATGPEVARKLVSLKEGRFDISVQRVLKHVRRKRQLSAHGKDGQAVFCVTEGCLGQAHRASPVSILFPLRATQDALGHKPVAMTVTDSHVAPDFLLKVIEKLVPLPPVAASHEPTDISTGTSAFSQEESQSTHMP